MSFYSLQNYTTYSILSGVKTVDEWLDQCEDLGHNYFGVSEKNNLGSALKIQEECKDRDITPIIGEDFHVTEDSREKSGSSDIECCLLLYAKNYDGFRNLVSLNNYANKRQDSGGGFYYKPRIDFDKIHEFSQDLSIVIPPILRNIDYFEQDENFDHLYDLKSEFGDDFYMGVNPHHEATLSFSLNYPWQKIFTFHCHYPERGQHELYETVRSIDKSSQKKHYNLDRSVNDAYLPFEEEARDRLREKVEESSHINADPQELWDECCQNLEKLGEKSEQYEIPTGEYYIPQVDLEADTVEEEMKRLVLEGFKDKLCSDIDLKLEDFDNFEQLREWGNRKPEIQLRRGNDEVRELDTLDTYIDRIEHEFSVIKENDYLDYFLSVRELCKKSDREGWERGDGRGSAAGSLLCYILNITKVDPIYHDLLFERFLNPDRNDLPDIDLDFEQSKRENLKDFVRNKWGEDSVCNIGTYDRMKVTSAVKSVGKAHDWGIPDNNGDIVSYNYQKINGIVSNLHTTQTARGKDELEELVEYEQFSEFYERHSDWFGEYIMPLQDTITAQSVHAAGVVVTDEHLDRCLPAYEHADKGMVSQWEDSYCEKRGYVKFDILGLKNLDKVGYAKRLIKERHGDEVPELRDISFHDHSALAFFEDADTEGIFQFLTYSQKNFLQRLEPESFLEICHAVALVRPGPQQAGADDEYVEVANDRKDPTYDHPDLEPILGDTKGVLLLQEQIMKIVKKVGGLTGSEADYVRKACGKKDHEEMKKWEEVFKEGGLENGYDKDLLNLLWDKIKGFAEYGFNLAHSVSYASLAYYQAWIRARYPLEWWSAVMQFASDDKSNDENKYDYKHIVQGKGIDFIFPNVHGFSHRFEPAEDQNKIYWPLDAIHGIGEKSADKITEGGDRNSYEDMAEMMDKFTNKKIYKALIKAQFFNPLYPPWEAIERFVELREEHGYNDEVPYEMNHKDKFKWTKLRNEAYKMIVKPWKEIANFTDDVEAYKGDALSNVPENKIVVIGGIVDDIRNKKTRYGDDYAILRIKDDGERIKVMCWADFWANTELDKRGLRPRIGDLVQLIGAKAEWEPDDSDEVRHQVSLGNTKDDDKPNLCDPEMIAKVGFD